jgi:hypothetical protein
MLKLLSLLAAAAPDRLAPESLPLPESKTSNLTTFQTLDLLLICGAALVMALILFLWAYLTRKNRQQEVADDRGARILTRPDTHHSHHSSHHRHARKVRIRKRRVESEEAFGRNPTLAEAGGLPPLRPEEPEPPPSQVGPAPTPSPSSALPPIQPR